MTSRLFRYGPTKRTLRSALPRPGRVRSLRPSRCMSGWSRGSPGSERTAVGSLYFPRPKVKGSLWILRSYKRISSRNSRCSNRRLICWVDGPMVTLESKVLEKRGARGCSNSDYRVALLTCCDRQVVEDQELSDLYFDPTDLSRKVSLLGPPGAAPEPCPLCRARDWDFVLVDNLS